MDVGQLQLQMDGVTRSFAEWSALYADTYYPHLGQQCYRVPAQHFNEQKLVSVEAVRGVQLQEPDQSKARGDLAHTVVLEYFEEVGQCLLARGNGPLFIISSVDYDNYLARLKAPGDKKERRKKEKAEEDRGDVRARADDVRSRRGPPETQRAIPPRPKDMGKRVQRGDIDILIISQLFGMVLIEVKSTGMEDPAWSPSEEKRQETYRQVLRKAHDQLARASNVFRYVTPDLTPPPDLTLVIALPFISRCRLQSVLEDDAVKFSNNICFLCNDDLKGQADGEPSKVYSQPKSHVGGRTCPRDAGSGNDALGCVFQWWDDNMRKSNSSLPLSHMKSIVGRICGLMSIVSVWTRTKQRVEVRTQSQAVSEAGSRIADVVLLPAQAALLADRSCMRVCLTGPMGSGKTLMLQLKGRQWLEEGRQVVILNVRTSGRGRAVAYALEEGISSQDREGVISMGTVERHDFAIVEASMDQFAAKLEDSGSVENICFLLDELTQQTFDFVQHLSSRYRDCPIWCVAMFLHSPLEGFLHFRLGAVLRSPPSVQLLLRQLDLNPYHANAYTTRSAARGLPCDGPPVVLIQHRNHDTAQRPLYCVRCAEELADVLQDTLGLSSTVQDSTTSSEGSTSTARRPQQKAVEATPLAFRDVLLLLGVPVGAYRPAGNGLFKAATEDISKFCAHVLASPFLAVLKARGLPVSIVVDNTSKEIAVPLSDQIVLTDVTGSHGLERKVVFFLPGGPLFEDMGQQAGGSGCAPDVLHSLEQRFGNMFVSAAAEPAPSQPPSSSTGRGEDDNGEPGSADGIPACNRRFGMEVRGDSAALQAAFLAMRGCTGGEVGAGPEVGQGGETGADAVFLLPDVTDDVAGRREEVERLREAVSRLSMDDQDWLFLAAARCVAQFIFVVP